MSPDPIYLSVKNQVVLSTKPVWERFGFRFGPRGTHTSRTMMFQELTMLLEECSPRAEPDDYFSAITDDNCLEKKTASNREITARRLREFYALDPRVAAFRIFRHLWYAEENGRRLLSLLLALARDPLFRVTCIPILKTPPGEKVMPEHMIKAISQSVGERFNEDTVKNTAGRAFSSWSQSGHLNSPIRKIRQKVKPSPAAAAYAFFLGYLLNARGSLLFSTLFAQVLDCSAEEFLELAKEAKRLGFLDLNYAGGVVDISFNGLLTEDERRLVRDSN